MEPISLSSNTAWSDGGYLLKRTNGREFIMAKSSPGKFMREVRAEVGKVVWPTRAETVQTAIMVLIMTTILAIFFLGVDSVFSGVVQWLLSLANA